VLAATAWFLARGRSLSTGTTADERRGAGHLQVADGAFVLDGTYRIVTPVERFAPATLEAWACPAKYRYDCQFLIGSDILKRYGNSLGLCGPVLAAEYVPGMLKSEQIVPLHEWSHLAVVFGEGETRLYFNGKRVLTGPATKPGGGTTFIVGCAGIANPIDPYEGRIRCLRISKGERYLDDFVPDERFRPDLPDANAKAVLIYDGDSIDGDRVLDLSGAGNAGIVEKLIAPVASGVKMRSSNITPSGK